MRARSPRLGAVVLAAGHSSRMGALKPLLPLHGRPVLERAVRAVAPVAAEVVVVLGHRAAELEPVALAAGARPVANPDFEQGMFTSVQAGLRALPPELDGILVLPGDLPCVRPHTAAALAAAFRRTGAEVVYARFGGQRGHPVLLSAAVRPEVLAGAEGGLRTVLARHEARAVEVEVLDEGTLLDLDTPADCRRAEALRQDRAVPTAVEAWALLDGLAAPQGLRRHALAVARAATRLAEAVRAAGVPVDVGLVATAGFLHDVAKGAPRHARAGAHLLRRLGYPRVAAVVARHTDLRLRGDELGEAALVYLADKLVRGDRLVPLEERLRATLAAKGHGADARQAIALRYREAAAVAEAVRRCTGREPLALAAEAPEAQEAWG